MQRPPRPLIVKMSQLTHVNPCTLGNEDTRLALVIKLAQCMLYEPDPSLLVAMSLSLRASTLTDPTLYLIKCWTKIRNCVYHQMRDDYLLRRGQTDTSPERLPRASKALAMVIRTW